MKSSARWGIAGLLLIACGAGVFWFLSLILSESEYPERGTLKWNILLSDCVVRDLPLISLIGEPEYYYSAGDGAKPPECSIGYYSAQSTASLGEQIEQYLLSRGYVKSEKGYSKGMSRVEMSVKEADKKTLLNVMEYP